MSLFTPVAFLKRGFQATFVTSVSDTSNATTYTFTDASVGAADSTRKVYVTVHWGGAAVTLSSATIGGVSATIHEQDAQGSSRQCAIISAALPTGTTATVVITLTGGSSRCYIGIYRVIGQSGGPNTNKNNNLGASVTADVAALGGGAVIACVSGNVVGGTTSWTGVTENYDVESEAGFIASGGLATGTPAGTRTIAATVSSSSSTVEVMVAIN
jgi:hypothetical protein